MSAGILCEKQVQLLTESGRADTMRLYDASERPFKENYIGLSSIDIPLGGRYWELKGSCRTGTQYKVMDLTHRYSHGNGHKELGDEPVTLKKQQVYLFEADCGLDLRNTSIEGKATGRSSIGRLDVLVRLLVDNSNNYDHVSANSKHSLYIEVTPISFDLRVRKGTVLSQLRLFKGREYDISLTLDELSHEENDDYPVVTGNGDPYREPCKEKQIKNDIWFPFRLDLSPDPEAKISAFVAKDSKTLAPIDPDEKNHYNPRDYWEPLKVGDAIELQPDRLYILRSKERLRLPGHLALECKSYTTQMGEWRIEYAGFAHPYFGYMRENKKGTPIIFEVRGHNVPTILTDGIPLGNVRFLRMSKPADKPSGPQSYEEQELKLSKCFKPWN